MSNRQTLRPTDAELEILQVLWRLGPSTVREVHATLKTYKAVGYTTALKMLQIMVDKGLVVRDEAQRPHTYRARYSKEETQQLLLTDLMKRAFGGSASKLVMRALSDTSMSEEELQAIKRLINEIEETP